VILRALKTYGMYLADNGSNWYVSGVPDERWNNGELQQLRNVLGSAFEVVDQSPLMVSPNSGQVAGAAGPTATVPVPSATLAVSSPTPTTPPPASPTQTGTPIPSATRTPTPSRTATGTRTSTPVPAATWTATPSASPTLPPPGTTRSLVLRGASQMPDTWISPDYPSLNFGSTGSAHLQGAYTPDRLLFRPNLGALPAGATIQSATLQVYAYSATSSGNMLSAYQVLAPWGSSTATYSSPWSQPGLQAGTDYVAVADGTALLGGAGWLTVDVTAAVRAWQQGASNNGIMLRLSGGAPGAHYRVYMAESTTNQRPALSISYTGG